MSEYFISLESKILYQPVPVTVLTPDAGSVNGSPKEFYESSKRYPVLWLLHGADGDSRQWLSYTNIASYVKERQVIAVMPSAMNCDYGNNPQFGTGFRFLDFFFEELMPFIHNWFPASAQREDNVVSGLSMGAYGAILYGLTHPEKFGGVAPLSASFRESSFLEPFRHLRSQDFRELALADPAAFPTEYGPREEGIKLKEINLITKYPTVGAYLDSPECFWNRFPEAVQKGGLPSFFIGCGMEDWYYPMLQRFQSYAERLGAENMHFDFVPDYGHAYSFWDLEIKKVLDFFHMRGPK